MRAAWNSQRAAAQLCLHPEKSVSAHCAAPDCCPRRCNRLQPLEDFEGRRHTCAAALARHNERRREAKAARALASASGGSGDSSGGGRSTPTPGTTEGSGLSDVGAWLAELEAPTTSAAVAAAGAQLGSGGVMLLEPSSAHHATGRALTDDADALSAAAAAAAAAASLYGYTLHFKLPSLPSPAHLPSAALRSIADDDDLFFGAAAPPSCSIRPGCVLLTFDALVAAPAACADAAAAAAALRRAFAAAEAHARGATVLCRGGAAALLADAPLPAAPPPPRAPRLRPAAALLPGNDVAAPLVPFELLDAEPGCTLHARLAGQALRCEAVPGGTRARTSLRVRHVTAASATLAEGAALFELQRDDGGASASPPAAGHSAACPALSPPRAALLCGDAAVVAEVNAAADTAQRAGDAAADAALQRVILVLGAALRPDAPCRVLVAAASACVWLRWDASLRRLLYKPGGTSALVDDAGAMLLAAAAHAAAAGNANAAASVVDAAAAALWPAGALRSAGALLRRASDGEGHMQPACAADAALDSGPDAGTVAVLRALHSLLDATDAEAAPAVVAASSGTRSFNGVRAYRSALHWQVVYSLTLFASFVKLWLTVHLVLRRDQPPDISAASIGVFNAALLSRVRLHPLAGGAALAPADLPWPMVVYYARIYCAATVLLRIPVFAVAVRAATRIRRAHPRSQRYARVFYFCQAFDSAYNAGFELLILHATGATVEWPALLCMLQAAGCAIGMRNSAFPLLHMYGLIAHRALSTFAVVALTGQWRLFMRNPGYAALALVFATSAALAARREAAARDAEARQAAVAGGGESKKEL